MVFASSFIFEAKAQENEFFQYYLMCSKETNHIKLYDFGKKLAGGWAYWLKANKKDEIDYPVRTKVSFMTRALVGYNKQAGITEKSSGELYNCYNGYISTAKDQRWSSVHMGLIEYLPKTDKAKFLSLPER